MVGACRCHRVNDFLKFSEYVNLLSTEPPQKSAPGAPTNVSAVAGDGSATVSFSPPADNGGRKSVYTQYSEYVYKYLFCIPLSGRWTD